MNLKFGLFFIFIIFSTSQSYNEVSAASVPVKACSDVFEFNGEVYFCAEHREKGKEIFRSNGEPEGTSILRDIDPGRGDSSPSSFFKLNDFLYFTAENTVSGLSLWRTDGTSENTILVKRLAGSFAGGVEIVAQDDERVFLQTRSNQLYLSDGTTAGTKLVDASVTSDFAGLSFTIRSSYFLDDDSLFFVSFNTLYRLRISENISSEIFSFPTNQGACGFDTFLEQAASVPGRLVLRSSFNPCGDADQSLWISDYTAAGTRMTEPSGVRVLANFDEGALLCSLADSAYLTFSGNALVSVRAGFDDGSFCQNSVVEHAHNSAIYFQQLGSTDLWFKDFSARAPKIIDSASTFNDQSGLRDYASIGSDLYLATASFGGDSALFQFDSSSLELVELSKFNDQQLIGFHRAGNQLFMLFPEFARDSSRENGVRVDLTLRMFQPGGSTTLVRRIEGQGENDQVTMWNEGSRLYFQVLSEGDLFHSNGTSDSTYRLTYIEPDREADVTPEQEAAAKVIPGINLLLMDD